ncbi:TonB-dependent siderophore receptor [Azomonas macrocytogenes]|uniref:TonB-dependent siderophore receptor n=1 Tax=Azomonas macrocytogenes TaxID=69962 RepID=A0A839T1R0_AZOMA|nr:TonB-dependent receptor [Azomonas macrocytogenes]MBB3101885.1 TonB-dependent siderophore receptor [Azomonas macrocytogenes]
MSVIKPTYEFSGHFSGNVGRWDNYRGEVDVGGPLNESGSIRGRLAGSFQDQQSFLDHYKRINKAYYGIMEFDLSPQDMWTIGFDYNKSIPTGSGQAGIAIYDSEGNRTHAGRSFNTGAKWSAHEQYSQSIFTQWDRDYDNGWKSRVYYTFQVNGYDSEVGTAYGRPNVSDGNSSYLSAGQFRGKTKSHAAEAYASGPFQLFGREHELVLGVSYYRNHWKGKDWWNYTTSGTTTIPDYYAWTGEIQKPDWGRPSRHVDQLTQQRAGYITFRFKPTDDLAVIAGTRVTNYHMTRDYNVRDTGEMTPFAGIVYDLNDNYSLYASYTRIFMPTNLRDRNDQILKADRGNSYEAGLKGEWFNGRLNASIAYFEIREDDRAIYTDYDITANREIYTTAKAKTRGFEMELSGELFPRWNIQTGFTHKISRQDDTGEKVSTFEPQDLFKLYTTYQLSGKLNGLMIGGGAEYHGSTWQAVTNPIQGTVQNHQNPYWLASLMAQYKFTENLSTTLNITNLFDKHYFTNIGTYSTQEYGDPRNLILTTRWNF